jgi:exodeoxyribonuclease-1
MPVDDAPDIASSKCLGRDELERRAQVLAEDERLRHRLISTLEQIRDAKETSIHVEQQIYDGFYSSGDEEILHRFHDVAWKDRIQLIAKLEDRRLRQLGLRLLYFERPELLDDEVRRDIETQTLGRLIQDQITDAWLTLPNAIQEIDELLITTTGEQANCLREHRKLLLDRMERLTTTHVDTSSSNPAVA